MAWVYFKDKSIMEKKIKLVGHTHKAKNRIRELGDVWIVLDVGKFDGKHALMVRPVNDDINWYGRWVFAPDWSWTEIKE